MNTLTFSILDLTQMISKLFFEFYRIVRVVIGGAVLSTCLLVSPAGAVVTIEVNKGEVAGIPIAIVPFSIEGGGSASQPADVIQTDLGLSGRFELISKDNYISSPHDLESVQYKDWRLIKAEALVVGKVINLGNDQYEIRFRLIDVFREKQLAGQKFVISSKKIRKVSHQISDAIYRQLTGKPGAFDTKIAYVEVKGQIPNARYLLQVADSDGYDPKIVLESSQPILSPAWSPDGSRLAYVSFEKKRSMVFIQNVWTGERAGVAEYEGINSAPAWSPDGKKLALTLSKDGNPEIYIYDLASDQLARLTKHTAIDTEPAWSPDGKMIAFTSGRSGAPQIYRVPSIGGAPQRLTFNGVYNAGPDYSPDGESIVVITNQGNGYKVGLYSRNDRTVRELTRSKQDESPTFSPNGDMIMYATKKGGQSVLAAVSVDGQIQQTLQFQKGSVREPAWSPFNRRL